MERSASDGQQKRREAGALVRLISVLRQSRKSFSILRGAQGDRRGDCRLSNQCTALGAHWDAAISLFKVYLGG